jgi:hypothetical protein
MILRKMNFARAAMARVKGKNSLHDGSLPLPWGEGGGEGVILLREAIFSPIHRAYPLTLSLSPWERGPEATESPLRRGLDARLARRARPFTAIAAACALLSACMAEPPIAGARLGDATHSNIAALAARPSDLAVPRRTGPRDAVRRDAVLAGYREDGGQLKKESIATVPATQGGQR